MAFPYRITAAFPYRITVSAVKALVEIHAFAGVFKVPSLAIINEPLVLTLRGKNKHIILSLVHRNRNVFIDKSF